MNTELSNTLPESKVLAMAGFQVEGPVEDTQEDYYQDYSDEPSDEVDETNYDPYAGADVFEAEPLDTDIYGAEYEDYCPEFDG